MGAISRKNFLRATKTLTFQAGGQDFIQISGRFNQLNFSLRGLLTCTGGGALVGYAEKDAISRLQIVSTKYGTIADMTGIELVMWSRAYLGNAVGTIAVATTATVANCGFEASLPITCDSDESLTITVTWIAAITSIVDDALTYPAILRINAELMESEPEMKFAFRHVPAGASGVIGASAEFPHGNIPQVGGGWMLSGALVLANTAARGTLANAIDQIRMEASMGNMILDSSASLLQHAYALDGYQKARIVGVYPLRWRPFQHGSDSILTLVNLATATVDGSMICYQYVMIRSTEKAPTYPASSSSPAATAPPPAATTASSQGTVSRPDMRSRAVEAFRVPQRR